MGRENINNQEKSIVPYAIPRTNSLRIQEYISPGLEGQVWGVSGGIAQYITFPYPDIIIQADSFAEFPLVGEAGNLYFDRDASLYYIWTGSGYILLPGLTGFSMNLIGDSGPTQVIGNTADLYLLGVNGFSVIVSAVGIATITPPIGTADGQVLYWDNGTSTWSAVPLDGSDIANIPAGNIAATNVKDAIIELDAEKQAGIQYKEEGTNLGSSGTVVSLDIVGPGATVTRAGNNVTLTIAKQVIEFFSPNDGDTLITLANIPKTGTALVVNASNNILTPITDYTIIGAAITKVVAFGPSQGGEVNAQKVMVSYWV